MNLPPNDHGCAGEGGGRIEREIDLHKKEEKLKISDNDDSNDDDDEFSILPMAQLFEVFHLPNKLITQHHTSKKQESR